MKNITSVAVVLFALLVLATAPVAQADGSVPVTARISGSLGSEPLQWGKEIEATPGLEIKVNSSDGEFTISIDGFTVLDGSSPNCFVSVRKTVGKREFSVSTHLTCDAEETIRMTQGQLRIALSDCAVADSQPADSTAKLKIGFRPAMQAPQVIKPPHG